jgi:hypothetical protein
MLEFFKTNIAKIAFGSIGSIIAIVAALFSLDARYAHATDVDKTKLQTQDLIQDTSQTLRRQMLEDKLFELDMKKAQAKEKQLPPVESALKERYQRQLDQVNAVQSKSRSMNQSLPRD